MQASDKTEFSRAVGLLVRRMRDNCKLTQTEFCEKAGITQSMLSRIEIGTCEVSCFTLSRICAAADVDVLGVLRQVPVVVESMKLLDETLRTK